MADTYYPKVSLTARQWELVMWELGKHQTKELNRIRGYIFAQVEEARTKHLDYLRRRAIWDQQAAHSDGGDGGG